MTDAQGVERSHVALLDRKPGTIFGEVVVERLAYRRPGHSNLYPADGALNLPADKHSHGLRKLAARPPGHVPGLLRHPGRIGLSGGVAEDHPPGADLEEDEGVEDAQPNALDGQEVAGQDSPSMGAQEL